MSMSKREKTLAWAVGAVAGLLFLDSFVLTPYFKQRDALEELRIKNDSDAETAYATHNEELRLKEKWEQRRTQGLAHDPAEAEKQLLGAIKDWARETGLTIASVKPERIESKKELREIQLVASAAGSNDAVVKFMMKMQTAKFPVRVTEFQAGSRNDSQELSLQMRISTLYLTDVKDAKKDAKGGSSANGSKKSDVKNVAAKEANPESNPNRGGSGGGGGTRRGDEF